MEYSYKVQYAKTDRSTCKGCKKTIGKGTLRIAKLIPSPKFDGYMEHWFHSPCFFKKEKISTSSQLLGFDSLRLEDQETLRKLIGEKTESVSATLSSTLVSLNAKLWELKDLLDKNCQLKELREMLQRNGIPSTGGKSLLVNRVADAMIYGVAICPICQGREMWYTEGRYRCMAEREWGRCGFEGVRGVQVVAWIDDKTSPHSFIRDWTSVVHPRPVTKLTRPVVSEYLRDPKYPLKGMTFACAGRLFKRSKHEFKTLVITHGGNFSDDVNADVDYVVSTYSELLRNRPKIARAKELDIAVVTELLVDRLIEEFGFDQSEYLLQGRLPPIAHAKVVLSPTTQTQIHTQSQTSQNTTQSHQLSARKGHIYPEAGCPNGKIYVGRDDDDKGVAYDLLLTQADIVSGVNKYYHLQLIDVDGKEKRYCVFAKYGRVGTDVGATYKSEPSGLTTAKIIFAEKYLDKTGNKWEERDKFVKKPGKYFPLEVVGPSQENENEKSLGRPQEIVVPSYLDPRVQDVVKLIFDVNMMTRQMQDMAIDVNKLPFGKLTQEHIMRGYEVLRKIEEVLNTTSDTKHFQLLNLSNQFYTLIPHILPQNQKLPVIDTFALLHTKMNQLQSLLDIQIASSLMKEQQPLTAVHPIDANYKKLGIELEPVNKLSREWKMLLRYLESGYLERMKDEFSVTLLDAFRVTRPTENERFKEFQELRPRKLLWHGSRLCNYVGILNQGLRIAPKEAPTSGYMFGKGIYFADIFAKSASFCFCNPDNNIGLLLLCDVALGSSYETKKPEYMEKPPPGKHSTYAQARFIPDPTSDEIGEERVIIPLGKPVESNLPNVFLEYPEYVVYNPSQVRIRYLLKVQFLFNKKSEQNSTI